jgi:hypothetical protein
MKTILKSISDKKYLTNKGVPISQLAISSNQILYSAMLSFRNKRRRKTFLEKQKGIYIPLTCFPGVPKENSLVQNKIHQVIM